MITVATRKILTINIEFELGDRKAGKKRLEAVYNGAVEGAINAASAELLEGGLVDVRHSMTFDYRWAEKNSSTPIGGDAWDEDEES
ncbi:hypothetical protein [Actinophytocola sp. NPDC049390]|uniref:hypothetical protein n=1 Tax=Actinophytocola sp. NPDC049390 TaxID=3363894 RepID=UPI0037A3AF62